MKHKDIFNIYTK